MAYGHIRWSNKSTVHSNTKWPFWKIITLTINPCFFKQVNCAFKHKVAILKNYYTNHKTMFFCFQGTLNTLFWISNTVSSAAVKNGATITWHFWLGMASSKLSESGHKLTRHLHINRTETELWPITTDFKRASVPHCGTSSYPTIVWTYTNIALQLLCMAWHDSKSSATNTITRPSLLHYQTYLYKHQDLKIQGFLMTMCYSKHYFILISVPWIFYYFVHWPTNAQLFHKLSLYYMFPHYRVILRQPVINTLPSYTSNSNAAAGNTIYN